MRCQKKRILSNCIRRILTSVIEKFKIICFDTYDIDKIGAFTYSSNIGSLRGLKKSGFKVKEFFVEDGAESVYLECTK